MKRICDLLEEKGRDIWALSPEATVYDAIDKMADKGVGALRVMDGQLTIGMLAAFQSLTETYLDDVDWEPGQDIDRRAARLLPGLFLARIDGKSPVEYLTEERDKHTVRRIARSFLACPPDCLAEIRKVWASEIHPVS